MQTRNDINWAPFNSIINGKYIVKEIEKNKNKINKPILDEEQIKEIEKTITESMIKQTEVDILYYQKGFLYHLSGTITKINSAIQKIYLNNNKYVYFCEIINIKEKIY
ncbi:MAG: YolD-like family protein [Tenericutes bacterium]|nr:YolD-like family protein [Mycoplasmatota bacterium]